jgi:hypothetical protein
MSNVWGTYIAGKYFQAVAASQSEAALKLRLQYLSGARGGDLRIGLGDFVPFRVVPQKAGRA